MFIPPHIYKHIYMHCTDTKVWFSSVKGKYCIYFPNIKAWIKKNILEERKVPVENTLC